MNIGHKPQGPVSAVSGLLAAWGPVLVLIAVCLALGFGGDVARGLGRYERDALEAGELWRLVSGHLVHLSFGHLAMNLAALVLIRLLLDDALTAVDWAGSMLSAALAIDLGLYFFDGDVGWYVGLSGVLHGLLATGALVLLRSMPAFGALLAGGLILKLLWEQTVGPLPLSESTTGGPVIVAAHLYGAAGGAAYALFIRTVRGRRAAPL